MCRRSSSVTYSYLPFFFFSLFCLAASSAHAKRISFNDTQFSVELFGTGYKAPTSTLVPSGGAFISSFGKEFGLGLAFDMGSVIVLRPSIAILSIPKADANGVDSSDSRSFSQTMESSGMVYSGKISLIPFVSKDANRRVYFGGGFGIANVSIKRQRTYQSGAGETNSQEASGSALYYEGHLGFEFFLVQNYTLALEAGYRKLAIDKFTHSSGTDMQGNTVSEGATLTDSSSANEDFTSSGAIFSIYFRLHF